MLKYLTTLDVALSALQLDEIKAIAQAGLAYAQCPYDVERYSRLLALVATVSVAGSSHTEKNWLDTFYADLNYQTPKLCVRAVVLQADKILLVKERQAERWSLPGGFADINFSAAENVLKELKEEAGVEATVTRLLAFWDKNKHAHPPHRPHMYQSYFLCQPISSHFVPSHEISDCDYFSLNQLPQLCTHRVTEAQLHTLYQLATTKSEAAFD